jgi:hypothetical protein
MTDQRPIHSAVLVKQVPDTHNITGEVMTKDGTMNRGALPAIFNPEDLNALEMALEIKERTGGTVTVITMGPPKAANILRDCLFRGADRVILLTDRKFAGADTLATSYVLQCAVQKAGPFDLVLCGRQAIDGDTAQVGPQTAEKLGIPQITYAETHHRDHLDPRHRRARPRLRFGDRPLHAAGPAHGRRLGQHASARQRPPPDGAQARGRPERIRRHSGAVARVRVGRGTRRLPHASAT